MLPLTASNAYSVCSSVMSDSLDWVRLLYPWNSSGKNTGVGCHSLMRKHTPLCLIFIDLPRLLLHQPLLLSAFDLCCCSVTKLCPTLCKPMGRSTPGFPVLHHLPEFAQTHVHWVSDTITPSHSLLSPSPPAFNLSQHQGLSQWVSSSHQVAKILELQHQFLQWVFRVGLL